MGKGTPMQRHSRDERGPLLLLDTGAHQTDVKVQPTCWGMSCRHGAGRSNCAACLRDYLRIEFETAAGW